MRFARRGHGASHPASCRPPETHGGRSTALGQADDQASSQIPDCLPRMPRRHPPGRPEPAWPVEQDAGEPGAVISRTPGSVGGRRKRTCSAGTSPAAYPAAAAVSRRTGGCNAARRAAERRRRRLGPEGSGDEGSGNAGQASPLGEPRLTADTVESPLRRDPHGGFGERSGETDREQSRHRAPGLLCDDSDEGTGTEATNTRTAAEQPDARRPPVAEARRRPCP